jgi:hypothetical protein
VTLHARYRIRRHRVDQPPQCFGKKDKIRKKLEDDALGFNFGVRAKIYQETEFVARRVQVIEDLGAMLRGQLLHRLDFHDDLLTTIEVMLIFMLKSPVLVPQRELGLRPEDDTPVLEFEPETL